VYWGRIVHHLKHGLWKPNTHIIFVGYQARGTLGRLLVDGIKKVKLFGEEIGVKAQINTINGFSVHADQDDLLKWSDYFQSNPTFIITHGEEEIAEAFGRILEKRGRAVMVPQLGDSIELMKKREKNLCSRNTGNGKFGDSRNQFENQIPSRKENLYRDRR
jgi:metallo-beta-lactamase family protein